MVRVGAVAIALLVGLSGVAGCGTSSRARFIGAEPAASGTPSASVSASASASSGAGLTAADGTDVAACADGTCEIVVTGSVEVPLDQRFGFAKFEVRFVPPSTVTFDGSSRGGGYVGGSISGGGNIQANGILVRARIVRGEGAVLAFSPAR